LAIITDKKNFNRRSFFDTSKYLTLGMVEASFTLLSLNRHFRHVEVRNPGYQRSI